LLINGAEDTVSIGRLKSAYELDAQAVEENDTDSTLAKPKSILKSTGNTQPLKEGEGDVDSNTRFNSRKFIYVSDNPEPPPLEIDNPAPHVNLPLPIQGEQNLRRSSRAKRPPVRFGELVS